jgi:hypothetical protein
VLLSNGDLYSLSVLNVASLIASYSGATTSCEYNNDTYVLGSKLYWPDGSTTTLPETALFACAYSDGVIFTTKTGKLYLVLKSDKSISLLYSSTMLGNLEYSAGFVYVGDPSEWKVLKIDVSNLSISSINSSVLPAYVSVGTDLKIYVTALDDFNVYVINDSTSSLDVVLTLAEKVCFATYQSGTLVVSHYLKDFVYSYTPSNSVTGIVLSDRTGVPSMIGTSKSTVGCVQQLAIYTIDGVRTLVNGVIGSAVNNGDSLEISYDCTNKPIGSYNVPVIIGNQCYDFVVNVVPVTQKMSDIALSVMNKGLTGISSWSFSVPTGITNGVMSASRGTIKINGSLLTSSSRVNSGDTITIDVLNYSLLTDAPILTIEDSQFALPINNNSLTTIQAVNTTGCSINSQITELYKVPTGFPVGTYKIPEYQNIVVTKNGSVVTGSVTLAVGDSLSVTTPKTSQNWYDTREYYLLGPVTLVFSNRTEADLIPDTLVFDSTQWPFPSFTYLTNTLTISGITPGLFAMISVDNPFTSLIINGHNVGSITTVTNGDSIQLQFVHHGFTAYTINVKSQTESLGSVTFATESIVPIPLNGSNFQQFITKTTAKPNSIGLVPEKQMKIDRPNTVAIASSKLLEAIKSDAAFIHTDSKNANSSDHVFVRAKAHRSLKTLSANKYTMFHTENPEKTKVADSEWKVSNSINSFDIHKTLAGSNYSYLTYDTLNEFIPYPMNLYQRFIMPKVVLHDHYFKFINQPSKYSSNEVIADRVPIYPVHYKDKEFYVLRFFRIMQDKKILFRDKSEGRWIKHQTETTNSASTAKMAPRDIAVKTLATPGVFRNLPRTVSFTRFAKSQNVNQIHTFGRTFIVDSEKITINDTDVLIHGGFVSPAAVVDDAMLMGYTNYTIYPLKNGYTYRVNPLMHPQCGVKTGYYRAGWYMGGG